MVLAHCVVVAMASSDPARTQHLELLGLVYARAALSAEDAISLTDAAKSEISQRSNIEAG